jgi:hypothetical protein
VQASNSRSTARPIGRATPRVWSRIQDEQPKSSRKRRRSSADTGSSGSSLTHIDNRGGGDVQEVPDYEKFTTTEKEFRESYSSSFIFGQQAYSVDIAQCQVAKDEYIIWKLKGEIVKMREGRACSDGGH